MHNKICFDSMMGLLEFAIKVNNPYNKKDYIKHHLKSSM